MAAITAGVVAAGATAYAANESASASRDAARSQERAANQSIDANNAALDQARDDTSAFRATGEGALARLTSGVNDSAFSQNAGTLESRGQSLLDLAGQGLEGRLGGQTTNYTRDNITNNPLFQDLMSESTRGITGNNAALGKLGSGDTLKDLTTASLGLGSSLYGQELAQQNIDTSNLFTAAGMGGDMINSGNAIRTNQNNQLFNIASMGANAASGQATATQNTAANNSSLLTGAANANAAGIMGAANANINAANNLTGIAAYTLPLIEAEFNND